MVIQRRHSIKAFTLIEALVATVILAGSVASITALTSRCMVRTRLNQDYDRAWQLMDRQLTLIDAMGIDQFLEQRNNQGEIEDGDITFQWVVDAALQEIDQLYIINMRISWIKGNRGYSITAATCLNGPDPDAAQGDIG